MLDDAFVEAGWIADSINTKGEQSGAPQTGSSKKSIVDSTP
jgi:hypothetical protein